MGINKLFFQRLGTSTADGYDLKLVNNFISFNWNGSFYHQLILLIQIDGTMFTFNGTNYKLYIDGIPVQSAVSVIL
jgi:hypothetical protein